MSTSYSTSLTPKSNRVSASRPPRGPIQVSSPRPAQAKRQRSTCGEDRGALTPLGGRAASVALALMVLAGAAAPAVAQQVVYDPRNHAENVLQAARQLESLANEARLISQQARALAATLAGKPTPVAYPVMPVVVKTPAWPTVVCPPPADAAGQWEVTTSDDALEARFVSASSAEQAGALLGFVLQGKAVSQRQAWVAQVSA